MKVYATCPQRAGSAPGEFVARVGQVGRWAEEAGLEGLLVFTDGWSPDPWSVAQVLVERTERIAPLVAVQPAYTHPYTAARLVSTIAALFGRRVDLNLVTGGFVPHLVSLGHDLSHDARYDRLVEYGGAMLALLRGDRVTAAVGRHELAGAVLSPSLPADLAPRVFVAGTSAAAHRAAAALGATRLLYPRPLPEYAGRSASVRGAGIRVGLIARETSARAWRLANRRFPPDPEFERTRGRVAVGSGSQWHDELWADSAVPPPLPDPYWLHPFRASNEYCPFLVGSHDEVAERLSAYLALGLDTLVLSTPWEADDLHHARIVLDRVAALAPSAGTAGSG